MNNNLNRILNDISVDNKSSSNDNNANVKSNNLQKITNSQFAAENIIEVLEKKSINQTHASTQISNLKEEPVKELIANENMSIKNDNVKIQVTRNISNYVPYQNNDQGVRILSDGKIYKKKFLVKIIGVGGAGNNIIRYLSSHKEWPDFVEIIALNTDYNALTRIPEVKERYIIGHEKLNGNGAGGDPKIAREAAELDVEIIKKSISGADILLIVAGLGKGTGTGIAPLIAKIASEMGILTIGLFNLPSIGAEGKRIYSIALKGLEELQKCCNGYTAIANDRVIGVDRERTSIKRAYDAANEYFKIIISEFIEMITIGSDVNIDFSDIKNFFSESNGFIFIKVNVTDYSKDSIKKSIEDAIQDGYIDIDIKDSSNALYNLKINENVPSIVLENSRNALKEIVKTNDLNVIQGMNFTGSHENAEINILISGKFDIGQFNNDIDSRINIKSEFNSLTDSHSNLSDHVSNNIMISEPTQAINGEFTFLTNKINNDSLNKTVLVENNNYSSNINIDTDKKKEKPKSGNFFKRFWKK
ncbi:MAG: cell division protein FtsZ [Mycoplasmoidaceae bacterium]